MAKINQDTPQFGSRKPANTGDSAHCAQCEAMLTDALDGTLATEEQVEFDLHVAGCASCEQMLADAKRGAAWLELLRTPRPEPPAALLERILAQTSGAPTLGVVSGQAAMGGPLLTMPAGGLPGDEAVVAVGRATVLPFPRRIAAAFNVKAMGHALMQPRLAMTAAMAFFSIGLTLNLTGVRLNELHARDLKPASVRRNFFQANAHVVRYVDNLRAVYELESRVRDLQRTSDAQPEPPSDQKTVPSQAQPDSKQPAQKQTRPHTGSGTSRRLGLNVPITVAVSRDVPFSRIPQRGEIA